VRGARQDGRTEEDGPTGSNFRPETALGRDVKQRPEPAPGPESKPGGPARWNAWLAFGALVAIVAAAVLLRFWDLAVNPGGLYGDEAAEGLDAARLLHQPGFHADFGVWFTSDGGREALFAYAVAAVFNFAGVTVLALRATAAAFGVAGVLGIWVLGRRFGTWVGLAAAAWAAGSLWLICISRDGMRNTIVPFFGAVALIALLHWAARPGRYSALIAGAVTSLAALYTYQPLKLLPILAVVWLIWLRHADRERYDRMRSGFIPFAVAFLVVGAPMIAVAVTNPVNYFGRATAVSAFNPAVDADSSIPVHILRTIGMFGFTGDGNGRHDIALLPLLPLPLVALAALGVWRLWRARRDAARSLILLSLPIFMLPPLIATEGYSPHFLRVLGLAAPLGVTIGLGAAELVEQLRRRWSRTTGGVAIAAVAVALAVIAAWSGFVYLNRSVADRYEPFRLDIAAAGRYAADRPRSAVIIDSYSAMEVEFLYWSNPPDIVDPTARIADPSAYRTIVALSRAALTNSLGIELGDRAVPVAWDPSGQPVVWAVTP
jgi:4-amino-4-deoxy-L-arabinose transferase-like glycosyltransferase